MTAAFRNIALVQTLSLAISFTVGCMGALAQNPKDEPTAEDLKNSKERNVILLPRTSSYIKSKTEAKSLQSGTHTSRSSLSKNTDKQRSHQASATPRANLQTGTTAHARQTGNSANSIHQSDKSAKTPTQIISAAGPPAQADSIINVWLDKKGASPQYKNGDKMKINVSASQDCNVMIFDFDGRGKLTQLYPNEYQQKTLLRAGDTITFGGADSPFDYQVSLPKGSNQVQERIFVYAYPVSEKPLSIALNTEDGSPFRSGEMTLSQYKKMVAESKVFFNGGAKAAHEGTQQKSTERDVKIVPKTAGGAPGLKLVAAEEDKAGQPNKKEVSFTILGK